MGINICIKKYIIENRVSMSYTFIRLSLHANLCLITSEISGVINIRCILLYIENNSQYIISTSPLPRNTHFRYGTNWTQLITCIGKMNSA